MAKEIDWTQEALRTYVGIVQHLAAHWTKREVDKFDREVDSTLAVITVFPRAFRSSGSASIREAYIPPYHLLIYRIAPGRVELLTFWDTRRDPRRKPRFRHH